MLYGVRVGCRGAITAGGLVPWGAEQQYLGFLKETLKLLTSDGDLSVLLLLEHFELSLCEFTAEGAHMRSSVNVCVRA